MPSSLQNWMELHLLTYAAAAPQVAGLVGYLRSLPSPKWHEQLKEPRNVKKMVQLLHRRFLTHNVPYSPALKKKLRPVIWNGQIGEHSCLRDYETRATWDTDKLCPEIDDDLATTDEQGEAIDCTAESSGAGGSGKRAAAAGGGSCPLLPGNDGGGDVITYTSGPAPSPTCAASTGCGGHLCTGFWCNPGASTMVPPDYHDPKDPNAGSGSVPTTSIPGPGETTTSSSLSTTSSGAPPTGSPDPADIVATVLIALQQQVFIEPGQPANFTREWDVFGTKGETPISPCESEALVRKSDNGATPSAPGFPPTLGPFELVGKSCTYRNAGDKSVGSLDCDGRPKTSCEHIFKQGQKQECGPTLGTMTPVVRCRLYG